MAALTFAVTPLAGADPIALAPQHAGSHPTGTGADARFLRIDSSWQGSSVLWNETQGAYGSGDPIGSFGWGTGLWGRADFDRVQATAAGQGGPGAPTILQEHRGIRSTINHGNARYNECHAGTWGTAALLPFFSAAAPIGTCEDAEAGNPDQHNWTALFSGFIRITDAGLYNFSVLYDDGFFFRLIGDGGVALEIAEDYLNPRDREGFTNDLLLSEGLYGFELGAWNRLGAGVVDLRWTYGDETEWTLVPTKHLVPGSAIPEPALPLLVAVALGAALLTRRRHPQGARP